MGGRRPMPRGWRSCRGWSATTRCLAPARFEHAFRVTVRATNGYVYPASHRAGSASGALPMGARLRLKASRDLSGFTPELQKIFRAMQRYGLIVADNGIGHVRERDLRHAVEQRRPEPAFHSLTANDFEVITLGYHPAPGAPTNLRWP